MAQIAQHHFDKKIGIRDLGRTIATILQGASPAQHRAATPMSVLTAFAAAD